MDRGEDLENVYTGNKKFNIVITAAGLTMNLVANLVLSKGQVPLVYRNYS
jgi:hypothetical protein